MIHDANARLRTKDSRTTFVGNDPLNLACSHFQLPLASALIMSGIKSRRYKSTRSKSPDINAGGAEKPGLRRIVQKRILDDVFQSAASK